MSTRTLIRVTVNGEARELPGNTSVSSLLTVLGIAPDLVAVEVNRELVRKRDFAARTLCDGDQIEVVEFVGGG